MLEQRLSEVKQRHFKRNLRIILAVTTLSILCGTILFILSLSFYQSDPNELVDSFEYPTNGSSRDTVSTVMPKRNVNGHEQSDRTAYIAALNEYQNIIEPGLEKIDLQQWDPEQAALLDEHKQQAFAAFTNGDYKKALGGIEEARDRAERLLFESQREFDMAMSNAQKAYTADDLEGAKNYINSALILDKQSEQAKALAVKIRQLAETTPLLEQAVVARTENNPERELAIINKILQKAPDRQSAIKRKDFLIAIIRQQEFKSRVDQTYIAINSEDIETAKKTYTQAKAIYSDRAEITILSEAIQGLEKKLYYRKHYQKALDAMRADNWSKVRENLNQALSVEANDKELNELLIKADKILAVERKLNKYLSNPYRLANLNVKSAAKKLIDESQKYLALSPRLGDKIKSVSEMIAVMKKKVSVRVRSDNNTVIFVRGVGRVSPTDEKTILLIPGRYQFEGRRIGYKSKFFDVLIPFDKSHFQITIICDEPI